MVEVATMTVPIKKRRSEQAYVIDALKRLRQIKVKCRWEAPVMGRSVDLAFLFEGKVHTIEFKLSDWRRAFAQARDHQLGADRAYICLPGRTITPSMRSQAEKTGIGLLIYQDNTEWPFAVAVPAADSPVVSRPVRERLLNSLT
jgi:hypothetical protein